MLWQQRVTDGCNGVPGDDECAQLNGLAIDALLVRERREREQHLLQKLAGVVRLHVLSHQNEQPLLGRVKQPLVTRKRLQYDLQ